MFAIETPWNTARYIPKLRTASVQVVIRYYTSSVSSHLPEKRLGRDEAQALSAAGFKLGAVFQLFGRNRASFSKSIGQQQGEYAQEYASNTILQPDGSAIYFGVDYDASDSDIRDAILPYFEGVAESFADAPNGVRYDIGVYGSWKVCERCVAAGNVSFAWLAQARAWGGRQGYNKYAESRKWNLKQGFPSIDLGGLDYDPNESNDDKGPFGQFQVAVTGPVTPSGTRFIVIARPNLRLRSGPGLNFDIIGSVAFGIEVTVAQRDGDWAFVDINGDGGIDGAVHAGFLKPA